MSSMTAVLNGKCPYCQRGTLYESFFALRETCEVCGARYERQEGVWVGPTTIGYGIGAVVGVGGGVAMLLTDTYFKGAEVLLGLVACASVLASYRFVKAWWIGLLFDWGYVYPDPAPRPELPQVTANVAPAGTDQGPSTPA